MEVVIALFIFVTCAFDDAALPLEDKRPGRARSRRRTSSRPNVETGPTLEDKRRSRARAAIVTNPSDEPPRENRCVAG